MERVCELPECEVTFEPKTHNQKYCSPVHMKRVRSRNHHARDREARRKEIAVYLVCALPECDETFETTRINGPNARKYCSKTHASRHKKRKSDAKQAKPKVTKLCELPECDNEFETIESEGDNAKRFCSDAHKKLNAQRRWYAANPEKTAGHLRKYLGTEIGYAKSRAASSRTTAKKRGAVIDPELTTAILADILLNTLACAHCANELDIHDRIIEHKLAICNGGKHEESNIQILCEDCHKIKTPLDLLDAWDARAAS